MALLQRGKTKDVYSHGDYTLELKFTDRMKALERLLELSGPSGEEQLEQLFRRMEDREE